MSNRLAKENSPDLRQHADNPVAVARSLKGSSC
jgi:uncharacterized protein YyaL (SSP411 family)